MNVLIAKQNEGIIKGILPNVKFHENTKNTSVISVSKATFERLHKEVKEQGYNPYALLFW